MKLAIHCLISFCFMFPANIAKSDGAIPERDVARVKELVDNLLSLAYQHPTYALCGTIERSNPRPETLFSPLSTVSDFVFCIDTPSKYQRSSVLAETINGRTDSIQVHPWISQEIVAGKVRVVEENRDINSRGRLPLSVLHMDPWSFSIASSSHYEGNFCKPGLIEDICNLEKLVSFNRNKSGDEVAIFQLGEKGRVSILFAKDKEFLPTVVSWFASIRSLDSKSRDEYSLLIWYLFTEP